MTNFWIAERPSMHPNIIGNFNLIFTFLGNYSQCTILFSGQQFNSTCTCTSFKSINSYTMYMYYTFIVGLMPEKYTINLKYLAFTLTE